MADCGLATRVVMLRTVLVLAAVFLTSKAFADPITLTCNLSSREVYKTGKGSSAKWKNETSKSYIEKVEIDIDANTWITRADMESPRPMSSVTDGEFVLLDFALENGKNNFRINRRTGAYTLDSVFYDLMKNETTESTIRGSCKKDVEEPQKF
jgi:hypothetical protein